MLTPELILQTISTLYIVNSYNINNQLFHILLFMILIKCKHVTCCYNICNLSDNKNIIFNHNKVNFMLVEVLYKCTRKDSLLGQNRSLLLPKLTYIVYIVHVYMNGVVVS